MKKYLWRLSRKLRRGSYPAQVSKLLLLSYAATLIFIPAIMTADAFLGENETEPDKSMWFAAIVVAPLLETFLFQYLPFRLMQKFKATRNHFAAYILSTSVLFGLFHSYSFQYMIFGFSAGLVFAYIFYLYHKSPTLAFWTTVLVHALRNTIAVLLHYLGG